MMVFFTVVMAGYLLLLLLLAYGWNRMPTPSAVAKGTKGMHRMISVVVPFRNEANQLHHLIRSLTELEYPADRFEAIFVNDHSEDNSLEVVRSLVHDKPNFFLVGLEDGHRGKKAAIAFGVERANGEVIATTDADCSVPGQWLQAINASFDEEGTRMVWGGVRLQGHTFFSALQAMEFSSLIGAGAATLSLGFFTMCNGANMAFRKQSFEAVNGYEGNVQVPSGDDEFLARKILGAFPQSARFLKTRKAVVISRPAPNLKAFVHQRLRWAGKWRYNPSWPARVLAVHILLAQVAFIGLLFMAGFADGPRWPVLSLIGAKICLEAAVVYPVARFLGARWPWAAFGLLQLMYPFYVIGIGVMSQGMDYRWKGRSLSHKM